MTELVLVKPGGRDFITADRREIVHDRTLPAPPAPAYGSGAARLWAVTGSAGGRLIGRQVAIVATPSWWLFELSGEELPEFEAALGPCLYERPVPGTGGEVDKFYNAAPLEAATQEWSPLFARRKAERQRFGDSLPDAGRNDIPHLVVYTTAWGSKEVARGKRAISGAEFTGLAPAGYCLVSVDEVGAETYADYLAGDFSFGH